MENFRSIYSGINCDVCEEKLYVKIPDVFMEGIVAKTVRSQRIKDEIREKCLLMFCKKCKEKTNENSIRKN